MQRRLSLTAVVLAALTAAGCTGESEPAPTETSAPASASPSAVASPTPTPGTSPTAPAADQTITITYAGGKVSGVSGLVKVKLNSSVLLVVTSDVADEVHFHGYDKSADIGQGGTVTIAFTATKPGRFVVELEKLGRRLVTLQIQ